MNQRAGLLLLVLTLLTGALKAQTCTTLGQNPETAFPVCGTSVFIQTSVPPCGGRVINAPGCTNATLGDLNPYWYKFTCFTSGTLGFTITPNNLGDDYDWQLFDITNRNPGDVYNDRSLFVACNWSGEVGITGASNAGTSLVVCATTTGSPYRPLFSSMPSIIQGHTYILLISHFSGDSQSGYKLSFGGGTADITDPKEPHLQAARAPCDGKTTVIKLNKRMKCNTLSANGSEFTLTPPLANVIGASGFGCSTGFDMDSVILTLDAALPPGNYTVNIRKGADGNTLADNCDRFIPENEGIPLTVYPVFPTPMDSITQPGCAPDELQLVFRKNINCGSIAADGSDFVVTGTTPVTVVGASGNCTNGLSPIIKIKLAAPIQTKGTYTVTLVTGSDGNTILDECDKESIPGQTVSFTTKDTVNADFTYSIIYGCKRDTVLYFHDGRNEVNKWKWNFDNLRGSSLQNPVISYASFGIKHTQLIVSNGVCSDTSEMKEILLDNYLKAGFETNSFVCPGDPALFRDTSKGKITNWYWDFANGNSSTLQSPPPQYYFTPLSNITITPQLIVQDSYGCRDTARRNILLPKNCFIAVPNAFTPNKDGLNDYLYPLNAYKADDLLFRVYNRFGQLMFETRDWTQKWDGTFRGQDADAGTYVWLLHYTLRDTGKRIEQKGTTILVR